MAGRHLPPPGRGNPKGTNRGGGRIKGQRRGMTKAQVLEAQETARHSANLAAATGRGVTPSRTGVLKSMDVLEQGMNYFFALAARYQPSPTNAEGDDKKFQLYMDKAGDFAAKLAPYQHQRLETQRIVQVPLDLTKLDDAELEQLERLHAKAANIGGDTGGAGAALN